MTPTVGRIVHYIEGDYEGHIFGEKHATGPDHSGFNGTRVHPAIITRVWSDDCVNLTVFFDTGAPAVRGSISRLDTPEDTHNPNSGWRWPPRTAQEKQL